MVGVGLGEGVIERHVDRRSEFGGRVELGDHYLRMGRWVLELILWIVAVFLVIAGIVTIVRKQVALGIVFIVVGLIVDPDGASINEPAAR